MSSPWPRHAPPYPVLPVTPKDTLRLVTIAPPAANDAAPSASPPDWVKEVRRKYTLRLTDWVTQAWAMTHSPRRFMDEWSTGKREALNPLRFLAVGTALSVLVGERGTRWLLHLEDTGNVWMQWLRTSLGTTLVLCAFAMTMHAVLRLRSRAPARSTIAAIIYSSAGPGALLKFLGWLVTIGIYLVLHRVPSLDSKGTPIPFPVMIAAWASFAWTVAALAGVHRVRWWWAALAVLAVPVSVALLAMAVGLAIGLARAF